MFLDLLFTAIFVFMVTCLAEVIAVPFVGTLVRFRANYAPKGVQLDEEGGVQPHAGPVVPSYFAMMQRVVRLEGWRGLYKGFMPSILSTFLVTVFIWAYIGAAVPRGQGRYSAPAATPAQLVVYTVFVTIVGLPFTIAINRAITTPYLLAWRAPTPALARLFTPSERRAPWRLYLAPGLLPAKALHLAYVILVLRSARALLLPSIDADIVPGAGVPPDFTPLRVGAYLALAALSAAVLCPLEVLATRLSLQRNHAAGEGYAVVQGEEGGEGASAGTEDVVGLRDEQDPYKGFVDAARRMRAEEGVGALYRGWWVTLLAGVFGAFV